MSQYTMLFRNDFVPELPSKMESLRGRHEALQVSNSHHVHQRVIKPPFPDTSRLALFGLGCFWGAERIFWQTAGVYTTAAGYSGGTTPNPTYEETCTGMTGHTESVLIVFDPKICSIENLLKLFQFLKKTKNLD